MNKIKLIFVIILLSFILISCSASREDISFKLNPGNDTVELNTEYIDPGAEAKVFGLKYNYEVIENTVDTSQVGMYYILYEFNHNDYTFNLIRVVTVVDETPPIITLNPGVDTIETGEIWNDSSVTVSDNSHQEITIETIGEVDHLTPGQYTIIYLATDIYGNESQTTRIVNVME